MVKKGREMTRRILLLVVVMAALFAPAATAGNGAFTTTWHFTTASDVIPVTCTNAPNGALAFDATGNGIGHFTGNSTGGWFTSTFTGVGTMTFGTLTSVFTPTGPTYQGKITEWFGDENNNQNGVEHATFNFHGTNVAAPFDALDLHAAFDVTMNANGTITANHFSVNCH
jgi:hypothetical protein